MVATKLSELAGKGWDWYSGPSTSTNLTDGSSSSSGVPTTLSQSTDGIHKPIVERNIPTLDDPHQVDSSISTYWHNARDSISQAAEQSYHLVSGAVSSVYGSYIDGDDSPPAIDRTSPALEDFSTPQKGTDNSRNSILLSPAIRKMFRNPSVVVRGGRVSEAYPLSSMQAVRTLLSEVPEIRQGESFDEESVMSSSSMIDNNSPVNESSERSQKQDSWGRFASSRIWESSRNETQEASSSNMYTPSSSETASQLAEGTLRALRDIALDEAVELHSALRYWSYRWERPYVSWLEAGPTVWFSHEGYQHQLVGQKVSQIQAVLARRCSTIGDLQHHLLRAGWQRGVAQWGVLGDGGEWAPIAGFDGRMNNEDNDTERNQDGTTTPPLLPPSAGQMRRVSSDLMDANILPPQKHELPGNAPVSNISNLPQQSEPRKLYYTNLSVKNNHGGQIVLDDPAQVEWSVDAMSLVRRQLFRAGNASYDIPYSTNWSKGHDNDASIPSTSYRSGRAAIAHERRLPVWASGKIATRESHEGTSEGVMTEQRSQVVISDLPLMVSEVREVLDVMEGIMGLQRDRRLNQLKPPSWARQNWFIGAIAAPAVGYMVYNMVQKGYTLVFLKSTAHMLLEFCKEHVVEPILAMYDEFTKGIDNVSDREARNVAIEMLQKMIRSWLDETHSFLPVEEREHLAKSMDMSLIEAHKENSMKSLFELNTVIRVSLIEAQFMKKEMMNALLALDEMKAATNFNMNIAAVTPFVLFMYTTKVMFQFVYYAMLKMGKSKAETYGSFLHTLIEIERLLVMRDNPPAPPRQMIRGAPNHTDIDDSLRGGIDSVLNKDDLGMLMLQIHELRTILWEDRRRFPSNVMRSVAEDLAELAGERGAVSVRQQLRIISRMCRTYPFLKAVSSRVVFEYAQR